MNPLSSKQSQQLKIFKKSLLEINKKINLVSRKRTEKQVEILIKNSLEAGKNLQKFFEPGPKKILDIGSGNGFPGLLFALLFPYQKFYLCERTRKKAQALQWMAYQMNLPHVEILCESARFLTPGFDRILSQASMPLSQLLPLSHKLLKTKGLGFLWVSKLDKIPHFPGLKIESLSSSSPLKRLLKLKKEALFA